jgi:hypothetical protein
MEASVNTRQTDPHDVSPGLSTKEIELVSRADEGPAHASEQIADADERLARVNEQTSKLEHDAPGRSPRTGFVGRRVAGRRYAASLPCC